jgi:hypothetical protein
MVCSSTDRAESRLDKRGAPDQHGAAGGWQILGRGLGDSSIRARWLLRADRSVPHSEA